MASQLAAQDYLARLSASTGGLSFGGLTGEGLVPGFDLLQAQQALGTFLFILKLTQNFDL